MAKSNRRNKTTKKKLAKQKTRRITRIKKEKGGQFNKRARNVMNSFIFVYYQRMGKIPDSWGEYETSIVDNYFTYFEGEYFNPRFYDQDFFDMMNDYLTSKQRNFWCDKMGLSHIERLKCNMGWDNRDYYNALHRICNEKYIPRDIFNKLQSEDRTTICSQLGADRGFAANECVWRGQFFDNKPPKCYGDSMKYDNLKPCRDPSPPY